MLGMRSAAVFAPLTALRSMAARPISVAESAWRCTSEPCLMAETVTSCKVSVSAEAMAAEGATAKHPKSSALKKC